MTPKQIETTVKFSEKLIHKLIHGTWLQRGTALATIGGIAGFAAIYHLGTLAQVGQEELRQAHHAMSDAQKAPADLLPVLGNIGHATAGYMADAPVQFSSGMLAAAKATDHKMHKDRDVSNPVAYDAGIAYQEAHHFDLAEIEDFARHAASLSKEMANIHEQLVYALHIPPESKSQDTDAKRWALARQQAGLIVMSIMHDEFPDIPLHPDYAKTLAAWRNGEVSIPNVARRSGQMLKETVRQNLLGNFAKDPALRLQVQDTLAMKAVMITPETRKLGLKDDLGQGSLDDAGLRRDAVKEMGENFEPDDI